MSAPVLTEAAARAKGMRLARIATWKVVLRRFDRAVVLAGNAGVPSATIGEACRGRDTAVRVARQRPYAATGLVLLATLVLETEARAARGAK